MVGRIFRAKKNMRVRNSVGRLRTVKKGQLLYHRGKNRYAVYSVHRDAKRTAGASNPPKGYHQTGDMRKRRRL